MKSKNCLHKCILSSAQAIILSLFLTSYTSCSTSSPPLNTWILLPVEQTVTTLWNNVDESCSCRFDGFSFYDAPFISDVVVENSFSFGIATFNTYIDNINFDLSTFSVVLNATYIYPGDYQGSLTFKYHDEPITIEGDSNNFTVTVLEETGVIYDGATFQQQKISFDDSVSFSFNNFQIVNIQAFDPTKLKCLSTFAEQLPDADVQIVIESPLSNNFVNIKININNASAGHLISKFTFTYEDTALDVQLNNDFELSLLSKPIIYEPTTTSVNLTINQGSAFSTISGFYFVGLSEEDKSLLSLRHDIDVGAGTISFSISDWNIDTHSFNLNVSLRNAPSDLQDTITGHIFFDYNGVPISDSTPEFCFNIIKPIPTAHFQIDYSNFTLQKILDVEGIANTNQLLIPSFIKKIDNLAFNDAVFKQFLIDHPHSLSFDTYSLCTVIGEQAFEGLSFTNDITLPFNVTEIMSKAFYQLNDNKTFSFPQPSCLKLIGQSAFQGARSTGNLTIDENIESVGDNAFDSSAFGSILTIKSNKMQVGKLCFANMPNVNEIDLSSLAEIPNWMMTMDSQIFSNIGSNVVSEERKGTVLVNSDIKLSEVSRYLTEYCKLPNNTWEIVQKK